LGEADLKPSTDPHRTGLMRVRTPARDGGGHDRLTNAAGSPVAIRSCGATRRLPASKREAERFEGESSARHARALTRASIEKSNSLEGVLREDRRKSLRVLNWAIRLTQTIRRSRVGVASPHRPCWERMGAWFVGETAGRPFPLPVLGRLSRAQSRMAAPSPSRCFAPSSTEMKLTPVTLPPGRLRLAVPRSEAGAD
jgi:hypothetical protein